MRKLSTLCLALILAASIVAGGCGKSDPTTTASPTQSTSSTVATATSTPPPVSTSTSTPGGSAGLVETLDEIGESVVLLRGLQPLETVEWNFMNSAELNAFLVQEIEEDRQDVSKSQSVLAILNLIPEDMDLYEFLLSLYTEQVAGLYDPETGQMYLISDADSFGPSGKLTYAHEYVHALQQQHFDIRSLQEAAKEDSEALAALDALLEGDASAFGFTYAFAFMSEQEMSELDEPGQDSPIFDQAPHAIQRTFLFPYVEGIEFVGALLQIGQLDALNAAYERLPVTTEQILHPDLYFNNETPVDVTIPDIASGLGAGWSEIDRNVLGEFTLRVYLETATEEEVAATAAAGWGGDRYVLVEGPEGERVLAALITWDTEEDALEFSEVGLAPLEGASNQRFLETDGSQTLLIIAPTQETIEAVKALF